ncbi:MAG: complex I NDUFA9 subunit family protein [Thermoleophilia bacterium]|nr:complex I NDUFA9 subunit family protein [Thermoleophilia bacterium]
MILVTGATGFIGPKVVHALRAQDLPVRALVRDRRKARQLEAWGAELAQGDTTRPDTLRAAVVGCRAVVHLVGIRTGRPEQFEAVMIRGTRDLAAAAKEAGVGRFVHMSASGVGEATKDLTPYYRAKLAAEQAVERSGIPFVIFRPTFVFGRDGGVLPTFIRLARWLPATPVIGAGDTRIQPIWIDDLAAFFAEAAHRDDVSGRVFELGGPDAVSLTELFERIRAALGVRRRPLLHVPVPVVRAQATLLELLPNPMITRDDLKMLTALDHVADVRPAVETFRLPLVPLDEQIRRAA